VKDPTQDVPLPPSKFGLLFHVYELFEQKIPKPPMSNSNEFFHPKLAKKAKQEIMRRYHPDKHQQTYADAEKYK